MGFFNGNRKSQPSITTERIMQRIGVAGVSRHTGTTHMSINLAITLRSLNYKVAVLEDNPSKHFELIASELECIDEGNRSYFNYKGVDYYYYCRPIPLFVIMQRNYDFLIIDHGEYVNCDRNTFYTNNINLITSGSRPWELDDFGNFMNAVQIEENAVDPEGRMSKQYNYVFMFAHDNYFFRKQIVEHMGEDMKIIFPSYKENLFDEPDYDTIKQLMPWIETPEEVRDKNKTRGFLGFRFDKGNEESENDASAQKGNAVITKGKTIKEEVHEEPITIEPIEIMEKEIFKEDITEEIDVSENLDKKDSFGNELLPAEYAPELDPEPVADLTTDINSKDEEGASKKDNDKSTEPATPFYTKYSKELAEKLFLEVREVQKYIMKHSGELADDPQNAVFLNAFVTKETTGAFGSMLRCKINHSRKNGKDGEAVIKISNNEIEYEIKEASLRDILGEDATYLISPNDDTYVKL